MPCPSLPSVSEWTITLSQSYRQRNGSQIFNVPYHRGMQPYLITYSHRYISSSLHGKLSKTLEATVKCIYYCLFKLQKDDSKDLYCIAHGKWVCKKIRLSQKL